LLNFLLRALLVLLLELEEVVKFREKNLVWVYFYWKFAYLDLLFGSKSLSFASVDPEFVSSGTIYLFLMTLLGQSLLSV